MSAARRVLPCVTTGVCPATDAYGIGNIEPGITSDVLPRMAFPAAAPSAFPSHRVEVPGRTTSYLNTIRSTPVPPATRALEEL